MNSQVVNCLGCALSDIKNLITETTEAKMCVCGGVGGGGRGSVGVGVGGVLELELGVGGSRLNLLVPLDLPAHE